MPPWKTPNGARVNPTAKKIKPMRSRLYFYFTLVLPVTARALWYGWCDAHRPDAGSHRRARSTDGVLREAQVSGVPVPKGGSAAEGPHPADRRHYNLNLTAGLAL